MENGSLWKQEILRALAVRRWFGISPVNIITVSPTRHPEFYLLTWILGTPRAYRYRYSGTLALYSLFTGTRERAPLGRKITHDTVQKINKQTNQQTYFRSYHTITVPLYLLPLEMCVLVGMNPPRLYLQHSHHRDPKLPDRAHSPC